MKMKKMLKLRSNFKLISCKWVKDKLLKYTVKHLDGVKN